MKLSLSTWNSININDGSSFTAWIPTGQLANLSANPVTVNRALAFPFLSTTVLNPHVFVIGINIVAGQNINAKRELLKQYFNIMDTTRHNLVALDTADSNKQYYLTGIPIRIAQEGESPNSFFITLAIETPVWRLMSAATDNWSITATAQTHAVTNSGNIPVSPSFAITPTAAKTGGLTYRRWVGIYNNLDISFNFPFDISGANGGGGGIDTASLTTAKMQSDGDDFLVMVDGVFVDRFLNNMDTANTQCWINITLSPAKTGSTSVSIASSGAVSTITLSTTSDNYNFLQAMARVPNKVVLIESEVFTFTGVDMVNYQLTGVTRAQKDSSMAAHSSANVRWIEHDIWILYGDSSLSAPDTNLDKEPMFDLATSLNEEVIYTYFHYPGIDRPGAWKPAVLDTKSGLSYYFTANQNAFANSADLRTTEMGLAMIAPPSQYNALIESAVLSWTLYHPAGISNLIWSGKKYMTGSWPSIVGLQYQQGDQLWYLAWDTEPAPTIPNTWQAFGPIDPQDATGFLDFFKTVRFVMDGSLSPVAGEQAMIQFDTVTVQIDTNSLPTSIIGPETSIVWLDIKLSNNTTGEYLKCKTHCLEDIGTLTIDCENKKAYLQDGSRVNVVLSTDRDNWLNLRAGSNTLQYDDTGTNAVTLVTTHRDGNI